MLENLPPDHPPPNIGSTRYARIDRDELALFSPIASVPFHIPAAWRPSNRPKWATVTTSGDELWGVRGMHIFAIVRYIFSGLIHRYRPELHYMRGPGPKWLERHGPSSGQPG